MRGLGVIFTAIAVVLATLQEASSHGIQPLSRISVHTTTFALNDNAYVKASPAILGLKVSCFCIISFFLIFICQLPVPHRKEEA